MGRVRGSKPDDRLTFWEALKDIGWLPLLLMSIGGLSIIDIAQRAVLEDFTFIAPFQIVLEGYRKVTGLLGAVIEPVVRPGLDAFGRWLDLSIELRPIWRPIFVLCLVSVMAWTRALWRQGERRQSVLVAVTLTSAALVGALVAGLVPQNVWWGQGLVAASPVMTVWLSTGVALVLVRRRRASLASQDLATWTRWSVIIGVCVFVAAGALAFALPRSAGVVVFGALIAFLGVFYVTQGLRDADRNNTRLGFAVLGGFVAAALVMLADLIIKSLAA